MTDIDAIRNCFAHCGPENTLRVVTHEQRMGYAALAAYDAKCEELAAAEQDAEDERAQLRRHCGCEFEDVEVAERPRIAICLPHLAVERERDAAVRALRLTRPLLDRFDQLLRRLARNRSDSFGELSSHVANGFEVARAIEAIDAQLAALAPPTEQQKVEASEREEKTS